MPLANDLPHELYSVGRSDSTPVLIAVARQKDMNNTGARERSQCRCNRHLGSRGVPKPDISPVDALRSTLLAAKSIVYPDSASGVYIGSEVFWRLGIEGRVESKSRMIPAEQVASVVANGEAEIGFHQVVEL
jgi:hypothetical protein